METRQQNDRKHKISGFVHGRFISGFPRLSPTDPIASPVLSGCDLGCDSPFFFPNFPPSSSVQRFPSKWRERQKITMLWLSVLAWQTLWGWLSDISLAPSCILTQNCLISTVFIFHWQLRSTATQSGRNRSWRQVLDGLRWQRCKSVRHGSSTRS